MAFDSPGRRLRFTNLRSKFRLPTTDGLQTYGFWRNLFLNNYPTDQQIAERVMVRYLRKTTANYLSHPEVNASLIDFGSDITGNRGVTAAIYPYDEANITLFALDQITTGIPATGTIVPSYKVYGSINVYNYTTETNTLTNITPTNHWVGSQPVYDPGNISPLVIADEEILKATGVYAPNPQYTNSGNTVTFVNDTTGSGVFRRTFNYDFANTALFGGTDTPLFDRVQRQFFSANLIPSVGFPGGLEEDARNWDYTGNVEIGITYGFRKYAYDEAPYSGYVGEDGRHYVQDFKTLDLYMVPGAGCSKNSQIDPANVDTTRRIIAKKSHPIELGNVAVTELDFESGGYTMAPTGSTNVDRATQEWFKGVVQGADRNLYCFRANTTADANITVLNPDTETLEISSKFALYNTGVGNSIVWQPNPILCGDGYIRVFATGTQGAITGNMMLSLDTNPESPTYQTGRLDDITQYPDVNYSTDYPGFIMDVDKNLYSFVTRNDGTINNANVVMQKYTIGSNAGVAYRQVFYSGPLRIRNPIIT